MYHGIPSSSLWLINVLQSLIRAKISMAKQYTYTCFIKLYYTASSISQHVLGTPHFPGLFLKKSAPARQRLMPPKSLITSCWHVSASEGQKSPQPGHCFTCRTLQLLLLLASACCTCFRTSAWIISLYAIIAHACCMWRWLSRCLSAVL
jgi:hypothetical protein